MMRIKFVIETNSETFKIILTLHSIAALRSWIFMRFLLIYLCINVDVNLGDIYEQKIFRNLPLFKKSFANEFNFIFVSST